MARAIKIEHIIEEVCDFYDVPQQDVLGSSKSVDALRARWMAWYVMRRLRKMSYPEIGRRFNGRWINHGTIFYGVKRLADRVPDWELDYDAIESKLLERYEQD